MISDVQHIFMHLLGICMCFLKNKYVYSGHLPTLKLFVYLFILLLGYMTSFILDINYLSDIWFIDIFFYFLDCLLVG